jgi:hypothetical protein
MMNRFLADTLSVLNVLTAILIIVGAAFWGYVAGGVWVFIGPIGGMVIASLACGAIAYLALIEGHLAAMAEGPRTQSEQPRRGPQERAEPTL